MASGMGRGVASGGAAIVRPPGHHAESGMAMGFCFFCNAALAARAAQVLPRSHAIDVVFHAGVCALLVVAGLAGKCVSACADWLHWVAAYCCAESASLELLP